MSASFHNSQQEITKLGNFMNCQNFSPKIQKFPGIPGGNFCSGGFPRIPGNSRTGIPGGLGDGGIWVLLYITKIGPSELFMG